MSSGEASIQEWQIDVSSSLLNEEFDLLVISEFLQNCLSLLGDHQLPESISELSVLLTDDRSIQRLNKNYRGKDKPTDVLSFSQLEGDGEVGSSLGDIVISVETAKRQAEEYKTTEEQELSRLLVHGLLHLLGYDHEDVSEDEAARMFELQEQILRKVSLHS